MDDELRTRIGEYNADYEAVTGKRCEHFVCPILHRDEETELCKGHVINKAFGTCGVWVPQRKDVDGFYGVVTEPDLLSVVQYRTKQPLDIWLDPNLSRMVRPKIEYEGKHWKYYFPLDNATQVSGQSLVDVVSHDGEAGQRIAFKVPNDEVLDANGKQINVIIERDDRPAVIASVLKAAHLSLFRLLGYRHVFSLAGLYLGDILRDFYEKFRNPKNVGPEHVAAHFMPHANMIMPMAFGSDPVFKGTIQDRKCIACFSATQGVFARGVVVNAGGDLFCVFVPDNPMTFSIYLDFLKQPPSSIAIKMEQYCPAKGGGEGRWELPPGEPERVELDQSLPVPAWGAKESE